MKSSSISVRMSRCPGAGRVVAVFCTWAPRQLGADFPLLSEAFADCAWSSPWPAPAAYLPFVTMAVGVGEPLVSSGIREGAHSIVFIVVAIVGALVSNAIGVMLLAGYTIGAVVVTVFRVDAWSAAVLLKEFIRLFISVLALAIPSLFIPRVAHGFVPPIPDHLTDRPGRQTIVRAALYAASCALLVFAWCRGLPTMLRPVASLATAAEARNIAPITWSWPVVVAAAAVAAFSRVMLEARVMAGPRAAAIIELKHQRWSGHRRRGVLRYVPKIVRRACSMLFLLFIFGGTFSSWADTVVTGFLLAFVFVARTRLVGRLPSHWIERLTRVPVLVRFTAALLAGYVLSAAVITALWSAASMRAVTVSTLLSLTLFTLLFPEGVQGSTDASFEQKAAAAGASLGCALIAFLFGSTVSAHAQGFYHGHSPRFRVEDPGCTGLTDCYPGPSAAATTSSSTAALASIVTPGIMNAGSPATDSPKAQPPNTGWLDQINHAVQSSKATSIHGVHVLGGSGHDSWLTFRRFAQPGKIHPHPNPALRTAGGYLAEMGDDAFIGYRPFTRSGPPAVDLQGVPGCKWLKRFKIAG